MKSYCFLIVLAYILLVKTGTEASNHNEEQEGSSYFNIFEAEFPVKFEEKQEAFQSKPLTNNLPEKNVIILNPIFEYYKGVKKNRSDEQMLHLLEREKDQCKKWHQILVKATEDLKNYEKNYCSATDDKKVLDKEKELQKNNDMNFYLTSLIKDLKKFLEIWRKDVCDYELGELNRYKVFYNKWYKWKSEKILEIPHIPDDNPTFDTICFYNKEINGIFECARSYQVSCSIRLNNYKKHQLELISKISEMIEKGMFKLDEFKLLLTQMVSMISQECSYLAKRYDQIRKAYVQREFSPRMNVEI